jgi:HD-like signal output (HDOD) protein
VAILPQDFLAKVADLGPMPTQITFAKLITYLNESDAEIEKIAEIIQLEPALSTAVLRFSNSVYFGRQMPSSSIQEAIGRLGTLEILKLVAIASTRETLSSDYKLYPFTTHQMWDISMLTAIIMDALADRADVEKFIAYSIGLLHSIGRTFLHHYLLEYNGAPKAPEVDYIALADWEQEQVGMTHADAGGLLMKSWGFPTRLSRPIECQYHPKDAEEEGAAASLLRISMAFAAQLSMPEVNKNLLLQTPKQYFKKVNLTPDIVLETEEEAREELIKVRTIFSKII